MRGQLAALGRWRLFQLQSTADDSDQRLDRAHGPAGRVARVLLGRGEWWGPRPSGANQRAPRGPEVRNRFYNH